MNYNVYEYIVYKMVHGSLDTRDMLNIEFQVTFAPSCVVQYTFCIFMEKSKERRICVSKSEVHSTVHRNTFL
jgi:hypothetical protein